MQRESVRERPSYVRAKSDDVTLSCLRYTRVPHGKGLIALQYDERFKLGQVDGDDARR